jgi:hypothetical protein
MYKISLTLGFAFLTYFGANAQSFKGWLFMSLKLVQPSLKNRMAGNRNMTPEMQKK